MKNLHATLTKIKTKAILFVAFIALSFSSQAQFLYSFGTSSPNSCDGYAYLDSTLVDVNAQITWAQSGQVVASGIWYLSNLCPGDYIVVFFDLQGNSITATFTIGGGSGNPCAGFSVELIGQDPSLNACDGSIEASISGGTGPYTISWSNNSLGSSITDLCAGFYSCNVTDANGCMTSAYTTLNEDVLTSDSIIVIINNTFPNGSITDTLYTSIIEDCDLDYSAVYSGSITNVTYNPAGVVVTWTIYDIDQNVLATYDIPYYNIPTNAGVFQATLIVYCDGRSVVDFIVQITDQFEYNASSAGLNINDAFQVSVVNPMGELLQANFSENIEGSVQLLDLNGRVVMTSTISGQEINMNTSALQHGLYVLQITSNKGTQIMKVLK